MQRRPEEIESVVVTRNGKSESVPLERLVLWCGKPSRIKRYLDALPAEYARRVGGGR